MFGVRQRKPPGHAAAEKLMTGLAGSLGAANPRVHGEVCTFSRNKLEIMWAAQDGNVQWE